MRLADSFADREKGRNKYMITFAAKTDVGKKRKLNQDFCIVSEERPALFVLCDGMGGHLSGDVASRTAAESIETYIRLQGTLDLTPGKAERILKRAISYANTIVYNRSLSNEIFSGMGTTAIVCLHDFDMLYIAHVGDSRAYLLRSGELKQLTKDHSLVEELVQSGMITKEEAVSHPKKNVITRAVGTSETIESDFLELPFMQDDIVLFCSDGLSNMLSEKEIKNLLISSDDMESVVSNLVESANKNGGTDNISAIVVKKLLKEEA